MDNKPTLPLAAVSSELNQVRTLAIILKDLIKALPKEDKAKLEIYEVTSKRRKGLIYSLYKVVEAINAVGGIKKD